MVEQNLYIDLSIVKRAIESTRNGEYSGCGIVHEMNGFKLQPYFFRVCELAAESGNLHGLQWLFKKGYPVNAGTLAFALINSHDHMIQYLCGIGCPADKPVMEGMLGAGKWKEWASILSERYPEWAESFLTA